VTRAEHYLTYADFLETDPRRRGDALESGHHWRAPTATTASAGMGKPASSQPNAYPPPSHGVMDPTCVTTSGSRAQQ
jgi:hypothetical protein